MVFYASCLSVVHECVSQRGRDILPGRTCCCTACVQAYARVHRLTQAVHDRTHTDVHRRTTTRIPGFSPAAVPRRTQAHTGSYPPLPHTDVQQTSTQTCTQNDVNVRLHQRLCSVYVYVCIRLYTSAQRLYSGINVCLRLYNLYTSAHDCTCLTCNSGARRAQTYTVHRQYTDTDVCRECTPWFPKTCVRKSRSSSSSSSNTLLLLRSSSSSSIRRDNSSSSTPPLQQQQYPPPTTTTTAAAAAVPASTAAAISAGRRSRQAQGPPQHQRAPRHSASSSSQDGTNRFSGGTSRPPGGKPGVQAAHADPARHPTRNAHAPSEHATGNAVPARRCTSTPAPDR